MIGGINIEFCVKGHIWHHIMTYFCCSIHISKQLYFCIGFFHFYFSIYRHTVLFSDFTCHTLAGLTSPSGYCLKGYYCTMNSTEANPIAKTYGDICPAGFYCGIGTGTPDPCPAGFYNPDTGMQTNDDACWSSVAIIVCVWF